jgi:hypothetical protein
LAPPDLADEHEVSFPIALTRSSLSAIRLLEHDPSVKTTAAEKVKRDARVVADRARGLRWTTVAERNGLSETQVRNTWRQRRSAEDFGSLRPAEVVDEACGVR